MAVTLTSPAYGKAVGETYTGPEEAWLLAEGYATQDGYTGPGVSNTGATDVDPADDPTLQANREDYWPTDKVEAVPYDFDAGGVNDDAPALESVEPATGAAAGGDEVTLSGSGLEGTTSVTFGGTEAASFEVVSDNEVTAVTPAGAAGAVDVVVTTDVGSDTLTGGYTFE